MNLSGNTFVALAADGRLFGLDPQLLFDAAVTAVNVSFTYIYSFQSCKEYVKKETGQDNK